jgi:hypothetical protein
MTLDFALLLVLAVTLTAWLVHDYIRRASRSYASASRVWTNLDTVAREILDADVSQPVARAVLALVALAGCGCFVRGVLMSHYLPRLMTVSAASSGKWNRAFDDVERLNVGQRELFSKLVTLVVIYDSFRNPMHGWVFRRMLRTYTKPIVPPAYRAEAQLASFSVLNRHRRAIAA